MGAVNLKMTTNSNGKVRIEMPQGTSIIRPDLGVSWMIIPAQNMYFEQPIDRNMQAQMAPESMGTVKKESLGHENINGRDAEKFKMTVDSSGRQDSMYQWMAAGGLVVRLQALDGSWTLDFENIKPGHQADSLFELPPGYEKMDLSSMGSLMAQAQSKHSPRHSRCCVWASRASPISHTPSPPQHSPATRTSSILLEISHALQAP